jgi:antitoxin component YwqK of YwqJK toxin-antitoxin module
MIIKLHHPISFISMDALPSVLEKYMIRELAALVIDLIPRTQYHVNGILVGEKVNGVRHGVWYHKNGLYRYYLGKKHGMCTKYYRSGPYDHGQRRCKTIYHMEHGVLHGQSVTCHSNGQIYLDTTYDEGRLCGSAYKYNYDGIKVAERHY